MMLARREFIAGTGAVLATVASGCSTLKGGSALYGLIGRIRTLPGERDALISILLEGQGGMPGCLSYIVAKDPTDADAVWVTEVWNDKSSHQASLSLPSVQEAMRRGKPLIAGFDEHFETEPVGGHGLAG